MENKLEIAARLHQSCFEKSNEEGCIDGYLNGKWGQSYKSFILGAQWQLENMWIPVEEMTEHDYDNNLLVMVEDGTVYLNGDTWELCMQKPTHYLIIPKFKKGE